jgi:hypothetical protein
LLRCNKTLHAMSARPWSESYQSLKQILDVPGRHACRLLRLSDQSLGTRNSEIGDGVLTPP